MIEVKRSLGSQRTRCARLVALATAFSAACMTCTSQKQTHQRAQRALSAASPSVALSMLQPGVESHEGAWIRFDSPERDFSIAMPQLPIQTGDTVSTPIGAQPVTRFKVSAIGCDFDAGYLERSQSMLAKLVTERTILRSACEGTASHMGGRVASSVPLTLDGSAGSEIEIQFDDDGQRSAAARIVITRDRIYHAIVRMPADASPPQTAAARVFLDSFHLATAQDDMAN